MSAQLRKTVLDYLKNHHTVSLASESDGLPHAASVFYVNLDFTLYFLSNPTSRHGANFSHNDRVSATVNEDYSDWLSIKGIQLEGRVEQIGGVLDHRRIAWAYARKFPTVSEFLFSPKKLGRAITRKVADVRFYRLEPSRIVFLDNEIAFGHRDELVFSNGSEQILQKVTS